MDITTMRIVATLASLACFIGIWWWAFARLARPFRRPPSCRSSKTESLHQNENFP